MRKAIVLSLLPFAMMTSAFTSAPITTPETDPDYIGTVKATFSRETGIGCNALFDITGADERMGYSTFIDTLAKTNPKTSGLEFYRGQDGKLDCHVMAPPGAGYSDQWYLDQYGINLDLYADETLSGYVEDGLAKVIQVYTPEQASELHK